MFHGTRAGQSFALDYYITAGFWNEAHSFLQHGWKDVRTDEHNWLRFLSLFEVMHTQR